MPKKQDKHPFYKRTENLTDFAFTSEEMLLLNKGLKYNLHHKPKKWIQTVAIEADRAVNLLPDIDRNYMRQLIANNIKKLVNKQKIKRDQHISIHSKYEYHKWNTLKSIKQKIKQNQLIVRKADKGNTLVIIHEDEYYLKIDNFITHNHFEKLLHNITNKQQHNIRTHINNSQHLINKSNRWKYINMNPRAPQIQGTVKLHKTNLPICPIVNWTKGPGYKLAKLISTLLTTKLQLPNVFNVHYTHHLIQSLNNIKIDTNTKLCYLT
jgi:hypothetical protein